MLAYRDEIDGLRAIAVIPVILYHAGFNTFFSGGYVGVDIFFVISGYLITSVIQNELDNQTFSLLHFYDRRCRRILPALFLILVLTIPFAYHWMLPDQLHEFGQTLISIVSLSSNFFFWWKDDGYFARLTELNPLVHTWSLAVEEQFYFVFPLLCYFFNHNKRLLFNILLYTGLASFFFAQWGDNLWSLDDGDWQMFAQHRWATFYLPTGRIWELLLGSYAGFYLRNNNPTKYVKVFLFE